MTQGKPSKTERKREQAALRKLGEKLIGLSAVELEALPIEEELKDALSQAASMHARGALRRQKQLVGKLLREADADAIQRALDARTSCDRRAKRVFALAEAWRDRVIAEGAPAVEELRAMSCDIDTRLEAILAEMRTTRNLRREKHLRREIFRLIHNALMTRAQDDRISR